MLRQAPGSGVVKLGTLDFDIVETTPVLFKGEVWRMVRETPLVCKAERHKDTD